MEASFVVITFEKDKICVPQEDLFLSHCRILTLSGGQALQWTHYGKVKMMIIGTLMVTENHQGHGLVSPNTQCSTSRIFVVRDETKYKKRSDLNTYGQKYGQTCQIILSRRKKNSIWRQCQEVDKNLSYCSVTFVIRRKKPTTRVSPSSLH